MKFDRTFFGGATFVVTLSAALLAACSRGGAETARAGVTVFRDLQGNYVVPCTRVVSLLGGNKFCLGQEPRGADGLAQSLGTRFGVKQ